MKKSTQKMRGITFALWPIWVGITSFLSSLIFQIIEQSWNAIPSLGIFKNWVYRVLWLLVLLSVVFIPLGIYRWVQSNKKQNTKIWNDLVMDPIRFGWKAMKQYFWFWVGLLIVVFGISQWYDFRLGQQFTFMQDASFMWTRDILISFVLLKVVGILLGLFFSITIIVSALRAVDQKPMSRKVSFSRFEVLWSLVLWTFLYMLIMIGWFILLVIPGIYRMVRFQFFPYFIIDKWYGARDALRASWRITEGHFWDIFIFKFLVWWVVFLGALALLIWLFAALPTIYIAQAKLYRMLLEKGAERLWDLKWMWEK